MIIIADMEQHTTTSTVGPIRYRSVCRMAAELKSRWNYHVRVIDCHGRDRLGATMTRPAADQMADRFEAELINLPFITIRGC